jgi:hypothetical protein
VSLCNFYWGSHGCDLELDDHEVHVCNPDAPDGPCSEFNETEGKVRYALYEVWINDITGQTTAEFKNWSRWDASTGWRQG